MKLKLNNKNFTSRYEDGKLVLKIDNDIDRIFFKKWNGESKNNNKINYVRDVDFFKISESGVLKNCFPILNMNEDLLEIVYDSLILQNPKK